MWEGRCRPSPKAEMWEGRRKAALRLPRSQESYSLSSSRGGSGVVTPQSSGVLSPSQSSPSGGQASCPCQPLPAGLVLTPRCPPALCSRGDLRWQERLACGWASCGCGVCWRRKRSG